jgi:hypothetical protein
VVPATIIRFSSAAANAAGLALSRSNLQAQLTAGGIEGEEATTRFSSADANAAALAVYTKHAASVGAYMQQKKRRTAEPRVVHSLTGGGGGSRARTVRVFRQGFTLEDAIEFHAFAPVKALPCV